MNQESAWDADVMEQTLSSGDESYPRVWARVAVLLIGFYVLNWIVSELATLPSNSYREPVLIVELAKSIAPSSSWVGPGGPIVVAVMIVGLMWHFRSQLMRGWGELAVSQSIRSVVVLIALLLAWTFSTQDTNLFFGELHALDRAILLLLVALIVWRPVFVAPFLILLLAIVGQLATPLPGYSPAEPKLLIHILVLFLAYVLLRGLTDRIQLSDFVVLMFVMVASSYWVPGFGKLRLGWVAHAHIDRFVVATYANGWLGFLDPDSVVGVAGAVASVDVGLTVFTLVAEVGALAVLWRRSTLMVWLAMWPALHAGVLFISGILFWNWFVLDIALLLIVWKQRYPQRIFSKPYFIAAAVLIFTSSVWLQPTSLSWLNTRITYTYRFVAIGESGEQYSLPPQFFAPYDFQFTLGLFPYLSEHPLLPLGWGASDVAAVAEAQVDSTDLPALSALEAELGLDFFDPRKGRVFEAFVRDFVAEFNRRGTKSDWISWFALPDLITFGRADSFDGEEQIVEVTVLLVVSQFDDSEYAEIRTEVLRKIEIPTLGSSDTPMSAASWRESAQPVSPLRSQTTRTLPMWR